MTDINIKDIHLELRQTCNPDGSPLRKAQLRMLEMLKFIDKVCTENNITYWIDSGTLLGAARHGGFIPWDDDTDICMPYEDMLKFKKLMLENNLTDNFVLQCHEKDDKYYRFWPVLRDLKSETFPENDNMHYSSKYRGLAVDIFPLEKNTCDMLFSWCRSQYKRHILKPLNSHKRKYIKRRPYVDKRYHQLNDTIIPFIRSVCRLFQAKPYYKMAFGCIFKDRYYIKDIYPLSRMDFEGCSFAVPGNYDAYLTNMYGDWRQIPDESQRQTHKLTKIIIND